MTKDNEGNTEIRLLRKDAYGERRLLSQGYPFVTHIIAYMGEVWQGTIMNVGLAQIPNQRVTVPLIPKPLL